MKKIIGKQIVPSKILILLMILGVAVFALTTYSVFYGSSTAFDNIRLEVYELRNVLMNGISIFITYMGNWQSIVLLCLTLTAIKPTRAKVGVPLTVSSLVVVAIYSQLKPIFGRMRPEEIYHLIPEHGLSFPSGHSFNGIFVFGMLAYLVCRNYDLSKKKKIVFASSCIFLALAIACSRVYVGVHYPTDIIAGLSLGLFFLAIGIFAYERFNK